MQLSIALSVLTGNFEQTEPNLACSEKMEVLLGQQLSQRLVFQFQLQACLMKGKSCEGDTQNDFGGQDSFNDEEVGEEREVAVITAVRRKRRSRSYYSGDRDSEKVAAAIVVKGNQTAAATIVAKMAAKEAGQFGEESRGSQSRGSQAQSNEATIVAMKAAKEVEATVAATMVVKRESNYDSEEESESYYNEEGSQEAEVNLATKKVEASIAARKVAIHMEEDSFAIRKFRKLGLSAFKLSQLALYFKQFPCVRDRKTKLVLVDSIRQKILSRSWLVLYSEY